MRRSPSRGPPRGINIRTTRLASQPRRGRSSSVRHAGHQRILAAGALGEPRRGADDGKRQACRAPSHSMATPTPRVCLCLTLHVVGALSASARMSVVRHPSNYGAWRRKESSGKPLVEGWLGSFMLTNRVPRCGMGCKATCQSWDRMCSIAGCTIRVAGESALVRPFSSSLILPLRFGWLLWDDSACR